MAMSKLVRFVVAGATMSLLLLLQAPTNLTADEGDPWWKCLPGIDPEYGTVHWDGQTVGDKATEPDGEHAEWGLKECFDSHVPFGGGGE